MRYAYTGVCWGTDISGWNDLINSSFLTSGESQRASQDRGNCKYTWFFSWNRTEDLNNPLNFKSAQTRNVICVCPGPQHPGHLNPGPTCGHQFHIGRRSRTTAKWGRHLWQDGSPEAAVCRGQRQDHPTDGREWGVLLKYSFAMDTILLSCYPYHISMHLWQNKLSLLSLQDFAHHFVLQDRSKLWKHV